MDDRGVERSREPDVLCDVGISKALWLQQGQSREVDARRTPQGSGYGVVGQPGADGVRRDPPARVRTLGHGGENVSFHRKGDEIRGTFRPDEVNVIRAVIGEVSELVAQGPSADPAVERLFPAVYPKNPTETAELRQYIEDDLRQGKL